MFRFNILIGSRTNCINICICQSDIRVRGRLRAVIEYSTRFNISKQFPFIQQNVPPNVWIVNSFRRSRGFILVLGLCHGLSWSQFCYTMPWIIQVWDNIVKTLYKNFKGQSFKKENLCLASAGSSSRGVSLVQNIQFSTKSSQSQNAYTSSCNVIIL